MIFLYVFCGPFGFGEFMSFFKSKVFRGSYTHQGMRIEKLVQKKQVTARDVESEIKILNKHVQTWSEGHFQVGQTDGHFPFGRAAGHFRVGQIGP